MVLTSPRNLSGSGSTRLSLGPWGLVSLYTRNSFKVHHCDCTLSLLFILKGIYLAVCLLYVQVTCHLSGVSTALTSRHPQTACCAVLKNIVNPYTIWLHPSIGWHSSSPCLIINGTAIIYKSGIRPHF